MFAQDQLFEILSALPDPAFILTRSGRYAGLFGGSDTRYYHDGSSLVGKAIGDVLNAEKTRWFLEQIDLALASGQLHIVKYGLAGGDVKGVPSAGPQDTIQFEGRVQALGFRVDGEDAVLWVATNVTAQHLLEQQLRSLSETDPLTGLWNRRHFGKVIGAERERALRYGHPVSLLIFDIDFFKVINDTHGHTAGDAVLVEMARVVAACTRESDLLTRWGGEEFTILMPYATLAMAAEAAEKIRQTVENHRFAAAHRVTISFGVGQWSLLDESIDMLLSRVDEALYQAKGGGRNRALSSLPAPGPGPASAADLRRHPRLVWRSRYESGDAELDRQHKTLFEGARQLTAQLSQATARTPLGADEQDAALALLDRLLAEVSEHFAFEEQLLSGADWPPSAAHRRAHEELMARALAYRQAFIDRATPGAASELVNFLALDVIANHMLRSDREFFTILKPRV